MKKAFWIIALLLVASIVANVWLMNRDPCKGDDDGTRHHLERIRPSTNHSPLRPSTQAGWCIYACRIRRRTPTVEVLPLQPHEDSLYTDG